MSKIIFTRPEDGGVSVVNPSTGIATVELAAQTVPAGVSYEIVDDNVIPSDQTYFDAWEMVGSQIAVNVSKAKDIAASSLRAEALETIRLCREKTDLGETVQYTEQQLQSAYQSALATLMTKTSVSEIESCLDSFTNTYVLEEQQGGGY